MVKLNDLYDKEVISIIDASRLGEITDLEINELSGVIESIIIQGKLRFFGFLGRKQDLTIPWGCVRVIGEETILVDLNISIEHNKVKSLQY